MGKFLPQTMSTHAFVARISVALVASIFIPAVSAQAANHIVNGGFETPKVPVGGFTNFTVGSAAITGWTVVGPAGRNVSIVSGSFVQNGISFKAKGGKQWLDLTGDQSNTIEGVSQTVTTITGQVYQLGFWVGNVFNPGGIFGTSSTVNVFVDGGHVLTAVNSINTGGAVQVWKHFTLRFTAQSTSTTLAFINGDPDNDETNGLDNVTLTCVPSTAC